MNRETTAEVTVNRETTAEITVNREKTAEVTSVSESPPISETISHTSGDENTLPRTVTSSNEEQTGSSTSTSVETSSMEVSETFAGASTTVDITNGNMETATAVESISSTGAINNQPQTSDFSDVLMSPGGRSDVTVAYEDNDAPSPRTPTPTFQSPLSRSPRKSKAKEDALTSAVSAQCFRENPTDSEMSITPVTRRVDDPVHPPTPCPAYEPQESEEQDSDSLLEETNIFAQKADPVHLPSPQHSRTDSPVSVISVDCDRNELTPTRRRNHISISTPPPPSPFSALIVSTPSPEILPPVAVEEDQESVKLITSARNRINEEYER